MRVAPVAVVALVACNARESRGPREIRLLGSERGRGEQRLVDHVLPAGLMAQLERVIQRPRGIGELTDTGDEISFRRDGVQDTVMRKLKRGEYRVEEVCDLHGLRVDEAKAHLREFLAAALAHKLRCVRIIHGKGKGSGPRGPVLKTAVNLILRKTAPVLAFTSARRVDGGTGAINVLLTDVPR